MDASTPNHPCRGVDSHIMLLTLWLVPLSQNSLERDTACSD